MSDNQSRFIRNFCRTLTIGNQPDLENWKRKCKQIILEPGGQEKTKAYSSREEVFYLRDTKYFNIIFGGFN